MDEMLRDASHHKHAGELTECNFKRGMTSLLTLHTPCQLINTMSESEAAASSLLS